MPGKCSGLDEKKRLIHADYSDTNDIQHINGNIDSNL